MLSALLDIPMPEMQLLLVEPADWLLAPQEEPDEEEQSNRSSILLPYWTDTTAPPSLVIPTQLDSIMGSYSPEKLAFLLFHEVAHAMLEADARPWPEESPLWADEWQMSFAALWLAQRVLGVQGVVMKDLHEVRAEIFEPELDGKTPVTVRGFDWYEDTTPQDYLDYTLLLERFAADLLAKYEETILPRFLLQYRRVTYPLLSEDVDLMLANVLGEGGMEWLDDLVYY